MKKSAAGAVCVASLCVFTLLSTGCAARHVYGDGSAGAKIIAASTAFADLNPQYTDFTVNSGVTLTVQSGTVIRCKGTFTNNGRIVVETGGRGARLLGGGTNTVDARYAPADAGVSLAPAGPGMFADSGLTIRGGFGGIGLSETQARMVLQAGTKAGGGGGGSNTQNGAAGGGSFGCLVKERNCQFWRDSGPWC